MPIDIKQLLALLQQGAPQQGAVMPPGGDPPPAAPKPAQPSVMDLLNKTASPLGVGPGEMMPQPPNGAPAPDLRASLGARMPTAQQGPKPQMPMGGPPPNATNWKDMTGHLNDLLGKESVGEEDSVLGKIGNLFPGIGGPLAQPAPQSTRMLIPGSGAPPSAQGGAGAPQEPAAGPQSLFQRLDAERGHTAEEKALMGAQGAGPTAQMFTEAAQEAVQRGADTPDKADELLRIEFQEDPEIESAISQARARYETARARSAEGPGVMEYIGYVLATLAGANPMQAAEAISRRGEKRQDEQMALQDLLGAQGMRIKDRQMRRQEAGQQGVALQRLMADQQEGAMRQQNRAEDQNFDRLKAGRGAALQRMNQLQQAIQYSTNPKEKQALQAELDNMKRRTQFFGRQLGEPEVDEQGKPMSVASPDAMRLLGLG